MFLVDGLAGLFLLHNAKDTVIQVLIKLLRVAESARAGRALASGVAAVSHGVIRARALLSAVGRGLLDSVHRGQVTLEDIGPVEALLSRRPRPRAKPAKHGAFVVGKSVSVLVIFPSESFGVVLASDNGALLRSLRLMREHMGLQVFEDPTAVWMRTASLGIVVIADTAGGRTTSRTPTVCGRGR